MKTRGCYQHTSGMGAEVFSNMLRKASEAVLEGNDPVPQQEEFGSGQPTLEEIYGRMEKLKSNSDRLDKKMDDMMIRYLEQHTTRQEHGARQPRLAMEADAHTNTKTRERTEGATTAVQAMRGDSCSARWVEPGSNSNSTCFGVKAEPPGLPCRDDVLVEDSNAAPRSCLPSLEMRSSTAAGGLVPTSEASTATGTNFNQPPLRFHSTKERDSEVSSREINQRALTPYDSYINSVFQESYLSAAPYCRRVVETKSR